MIRTGFVLGVVCLGLGLSEATAQAELSEVASFDEAALAKAGFVDSSDSEIAALKSTPDSQFAEQENLDDVTDPELAEVFAPNPTDVCNRTAAEIQMLAYDPFSR